MRQARVPAVGLVVCHGCCCGVAQPGRVDLVREFCAAHPGIAQLQVTGCLDRCAHADVVVVRPSHAGRLRWGRPVWFGLVDDQALARIHEWVRAGGPGLAPMPDDLAGHRIGRSHVRLR